MENFFAEDIVTRDLVYLEETMTRDSLINILEGPAATISTLPILEKLDYGKLSCKGTILTRYIRNYLDTVPGSPTDLIDFKKNSEHELTQFVNFTPICVSPSTPLSILFKLFQKLGCSSIVVENGGVIMGLTTKKDVVRFMRIKHKENFGPLYAFDDKIDKKAFHLIEFCISKFARR